MVTCESSHFFYMIKLFEDFVVVAAIVCIVIRFMKICCETYLPCNLDLLRITLLR